LTNAVQTLAGVLLPSATVFLLLLCNDKAILGPWVNSRRLNLFTGAVIVVLVLLSLILTMSVLFPGMGDAEILAILLGGSLVAIAAAMAVKFVNRTGSQPVETAASVADQKLLNSWRMPPLDQLPPARISTLNRIWLIVLRGYLVLAAGLVVVRIVLLATGQG
jgi:hypothetical protein